MPTPPTKPDPIKVAKQTAAARRLPAGKLTIKSDPPPEAPDTEIWRADLLCTLSEVALFAFGLDQFSGDAADVGEAHRLALKLRCFSTDLHPNTLVDGWLPPGAYDPDGSKRFPIDELIRRLQAFHRTGTRDPQNYARQTHEAIRGVVQAFNLPDPLTALGFAPATSHAKKTRRGYRSRQQRELTHKQLEAVHLVGQCAGNLSQAARQAGVDHKTMAQHYRAAMAKLGKHALPTPKPQKLPTDRRGQPQIASHDDGPNAPAGQRRIHRDKRSG